MSTSANLDAGSFRHLPRLFPDLQPLDLQPIALRSDISIKHLRPSTQDPYSFWGRVWNILLKILSWFINLKRPSAAIFKALACSSSGLKREVMQLYTKVLSQKSNEEAVPLLGQYENLLGEVASLLMEHDSDPTRALTTLKNRFVDGVQELQEGQQLLLPLSLENDVNVFYLLEKNQNGYSLKLIGCGESMAKLVDQAPKKIGGKEKILSQIAFENIPADYFDEDRILALFCVPLVAFNTVAIKALLHEIPEECQIDLSDRSDLWVTQSSSSRKAVGLVVQEIRHPQGEEVSASSKITRKRIELKARLFALFEFYKEARFFLEQDLGYLITLRYLTQEIAKEASLLHTKGYLLPAEILEIYQEMTAIEKTLNKATERVQDSLADLSHMPAFQLQIPAEVAAQHPVEVALTNTVDNVRQPQPCDLQLPVTVNSLLSDEEKHTLSSADPDAIFALIEEKTAYAQALVEQRNPRLAVALAVELGHSLKFADSPDYKEQELKRWWVSLSLEQAQQLQYHFLGLTEILVSNKEGTVPLPNQAIALLRFSLFSEWVYKSIDYVDVPRRYGFYKGMDKAELYDLICCLNDSFIARAFYLADEENIQILNPCYFTNALLYRNHGWTVNDENRVNFFGPAVIIDRSLAYLMQQTSLLVQFFETSRSSSPFFLDPGCSRFQILEKSFKPQLMQGWSKTFKNPLFPIVLRQMKMKVHTDPLHAIRRPSRRVETDNRADSLKYPEAANDDPVRVFEAQFDSLNEQVKEFRAEKWDHLRPKLLEFSKKELTDLLSLLRESAPQLEAIGFIKAHSHLLANSDIRNYLEIILFDLKGSLIKEDLLTHSTFACCLPDTLEEELKRYQELAKKDSSYYSHFLFIFSLLRKFKAIYQAIGEKNGLRRRLLFKEDLRKSLALFTEVMGKFDELLCKYSVKSILDDPSLYAYHFRATIEALSIQMQQGEDLVQIVRLYHSLQRMPRNVYEVNLNEMDKLQRRYITYLQSIAEVPVEQITPLLDAICIDQGFLLDHSEWAGEFPLFHNDQYEIDLSRGVVIQRTLGAVLVAMPAEVLANPSYTLVFEQVDARTQRVYALQEGERTLYLVSDKMGARGRVEIENGTYRFYKQDNDRLLQVILIPRGAEFTAIHCLSGGAFYIDPNVPEEGLCFNETGKLCFKLRLNSVEQQIQIQSVIDCRGEEESPPCEVHTLASISSVNPLTQFENSQEILIFARGGAMEKVEFIRYGLSFTYRKGKLYSDDPKLKGYFIDLKATRKDLPYSLTLRHKDKTIPAKLLLPDSSCLESRTTLEQRDLSRFQEFWLLIQAGCLKKIPTHDDLVEARLHEGPQRNHTRRVNAQLFEVLPFTSELISVDEKKRIPAALTLISHALFSKHPSLAKTAYKRLKLTDSDLTRKHVNELVRFLRAEPEDGCNSASLRIQLALQLKRLMGKKRRFENISNELCGLIQNHLLIYLQGGRRVDQRLVLNLADLTLAAKIIKKNNAAFYDEHLRVFFLEAGAQLPPFNQAGLPIWDGYAEINLKERVLQGKKLGAYGVTQLPLETLEQTLPPISEVQTQIQIEEGTPLLYQEAMLDRYFESIPYVLPEVLLPEVDASAPSCERKAVENLIEEMQRFREQMEGKKCHNLSPSQAADLKKEMQSLKKTLKEESELQRKQIEKILIGEDPVRALAITGGLQKVATFQELSLAFMQKDLVSLQDLLPPGVDLPMLEALVHTYFLTESRHLAIKNSMKVLQRLLDNSLSEDERLTQSTLLYQMLSTKRYYSPEQHPELLVYETFSSQIFRQANGEHNQIHLLHDILSRPNGVFQAGTGVGKTTVISTVRALLQANGTNLVTYKILPALVRQSKAIIQKKLGDPIEKKIYTLLFNLKTSLIIRKIGADGQEIETSLFKEIYQSLLITIREKGCLITDYKSFPLMQEKWHKMNLEFLLRPLDSIPPIELEHWTYLQKILKLLQEREETLMDEFDVPNRSRNRLQIPVVDSVPLPEFLYQESLELYKKLITNPRLKLAADMQSEVSDEIKQSVIEELAAELAGGNQDLYDYFLGRREADLSTYSPETRDQYTLYKDQLSYFLKAVLSKKNRTDYKRSADGSKTIPCHDGEPQEQSRFGHPLEEINHTIQDYMQKGVILPELLRWIKELQKASLTSQIPFKQFSEVFPGRELPKGDLDNENLQTLLTELNQDWEKVLIFLKITLSQLTTSGPVISMAPHDIAAMSRGVVGLSATLGCLEELPKAFHAEDATVNGIKGEMAYRLLQRTGLQQEPLVYDPENPLELFGQIRASAIIDGDGTFRAYEPEKVAEEFLQAQPHLRLVGYHRKKIESIGEAECNLSQRGFYFTQPAARGADVPLDPQALAILTVGKERSVEAIMQNDGRMRLKGQRIRLARSENAPELNSSEAVLIHAARNLGKEAAPGLFRSKMQETSHFVRQAGYQELIHTEGFEATLHRFGQLQQLFVQPSAHDYNTKGVYIPGTYHKRNHAIHEIGHPPQEVLSPKKQQELAKAATLNLAVPELEALEWSQKTLEQMPPLVSGIDETLIGLEIQQEVALEEMVEKTIELEVDTDIHQLEAKSDVPFYPPRIEAPEIYQAAKWFHPALDPRICFTENFLPVERNNPLFMRTPFDRAMPEIKVPQLIMERKHEPEVEFLPKGIIRYHYQIAVKQVVVGDVLEGVSTLFASADSLYYDIRTRKIMGTNVNFDENDTYTIEDYTDIISQLRFINGEYEGYSAEEWTALRNWLMSVEDLNDLQLFFEKTVLRRKPLQAAAFRKSPLYLLFEELKTSRTRAFK